MTGANSVSVSSTFASPCSSMNASAVRVEPRVERVEHARRSSARRSAPRSSPACWRASQPPCRRRRSRAPRARRPGAAQRSYVCAHVYRRSPWITAVRVRPREGGAGEERQRRQRRVVGRIAIEVVLVGVHAGSFLRRGRRVHRSIAVACPPPAIWLRSAALPRGIRAPMGHRLVEDRHAHRRRRHHRPRATARAWRRTRPASPPSAAVDELNSTLGVLLAEPLPDADRRLPRQRAARSLRPRRRAVDPRLHGGDRGARRTPRGRRRALQRGPGARSRNSSCPAAAAPPPWRTSRGRCAGVRSARSSPPPPPRRSRPAASTSTACPTSCSCSRARSTARPAGPTCCGARTGPGDRLREARQRAALQAPASRAGHRAGLRRTGALPCRQRQHRARRHVPAGRRTFPPPRAGSATRWRPADHRPQRAPGLSALPHRAGRPGGVRRVLRDHVGASIRRRAAYLEEPRRRGGDPAGGVRQRLAPRRRLRGREEPADDVAHVDRAQPLLRPAPPARDRHRDPDARRRRRTRARRCPPTP